MQYLHYYQKQPWLTDGQTTYVHVHIKTFIQNMQQVIYYRLLHVDILYNQLKILTGNRLFALLGT